VASPARSKFGELLRRHRGAAGLTQESLAEWAGISTRAISDLERGVHRAPQAETLSLLAAALGLSPEHRTELEAAAVSLRDTVLEDRPRPNRSDQSAVEARASLTTGWRDASGRQNNLPRPLTPFIGRRAELEAIRSLLLRGEARLLVLVGPGGIGKSRLALQAAADVQGAFRDGVVFVSLAPILVPDLAEATIARALGVPEDEDRPLRGRLKSHLEDKHLLLVLDNLEQVLAAAPLVADLLGACPQLAVLATSRAVLRLSGERVVAVPPLPLPEPARRLSLTQIAPNEAVRLFVDRARAVRSDFVLTEVNAGAVVEVCRRLEGLPLALELAAARVSTLTPSALLGRLERRLPLLTGGGGDRPPRQQTLRRTVAWSYDLLSASEQAVFRRLSVFVGGCDLEAAEAVGEGVGDAAPDAAGVLDLLASLVEKSLLRAEEATDGASRFVMLETIREYAAELLEASGEAPAASRRHAAFYLDLAGQAETGLAGTHQASWLERLEQERGNLRAALNWSVEHNEGEMATRLGAAAWRAERSIAVYEASLAFLRGLGGAVGTTPVARDLERLVHDLNRYARATVLREDQEAGRGGGRGAPGVAAAILELGGVMAERGDPERASVLYRAGLSLSRELGDRAGVVLSLSHLARLADERGQARRSARLRGALASLRRLTPIPAQGDDQPDRHDAAPAPAGRARTVDRTAGAGTGAYPLTGRELEVARLVARGLRNHQIADELVIARGTADRHVANILGKLGFVSRAQVAAWAVARGLHRPDSPEP
jgi:predicted ATPase/DNA-binding CsgD family transcriptional regulator/transcriptional regulator with XRE-family HTH domain